MAESYYDRKFRILVYYTYGVSKFALIRVVDR